MIIKQDNKEKKERKEKGKIMFRIVNLKTFNPFLDYKPSAHTRLGFGMIECYNEKNLVDYVFGKRSLSDQRNSIIVSVFFQGSLKPPELI